MNASNSDQVIKDIINVVVGGHKMIIFTTNILLQDIEDRCLLLTSSMSFVDLPFQEHRKTEKTSYGPKSIHIFIMSKTRGSLR
jgi:hypothetical protein